MITLAKLSDLDEIDQLSVLVIEDMKNSSIPQWTLSYPRKEHFKNDILQDALIIVKDESMILGCMAILEENDPPYKTINSWIGENSIVLHRILVHPTVRNKGVAKQMIDYSINYGKKHKYDSIKIDTHLENYKMRAFLQKNGFVEGDYIEVMNRIAYEKMLEE